MMKIIIFICAILAIQIDQSLCFQKKIVLPAERLNEDAANTTEAAVAVTDTTVVVETSTDSTTADQTPPAGFAIVTNSQNLSAYGLTTNNPILVEKTQTKVENIIASLSSLLPILNNDTSDLLDLYLRIRRRQVDYIASASRQIDNQIQKTLVLLTTDDDRQYPKSGVDIGYCTFATENGVPEVLASLRDELLVGLKNSSDPIFDDSLQNVTQGLRGVIFMKNFINSMPETMAICGDYIDQLACLNDIIVLRDLYVPKQVKTFLENKMTEIGKYVTTRMTDLNDNYRETIRVSKARCKAVVDTVDVCINNAI